MEHKGSSGFHRLLGQTESFNSQRVCTVAMFSFSLCYNTLDKGHDNNHSPGIVISASSPSCWYSKSRLWL